MKKIFAKAIFTAIAVMLIMATISGCDKNKEKEEVELVISSAVSLTDVMQELSAEYKKEAANITLTFSFGSSGALQTQIEQGAPADVFLSAGKKQMTALNDKGLLFKDTKIDLLENKIVLIVPKDSEKGIKTFNDVGTDLIKLIAVGEPASVPVGQYTEQIFEYLNIWDEVKAKTNYGSDVRQVLTWVENNEVDCGVVYATDAMGSDKIKVICEAPQGSSDKIIYPAAVIGRSTHPDEAKEFLAFLTSSKAKKIFEKFGFSMAE